MRGQRLLPVLLSFVLILVARAAAAHSCATIPNFGVVAYVPQREITFQWSAPAGAPAGTVYEVLRTTFPDSCHVNYSASVVATTTATTITISTPTPDQGYEFSVRLASDPCVTTEYWMGWDTFSTPPAKPVIASAIVSSADVVVTGSYSDGRAGALYLIRTGSDGKEVFVANPGPCPGFFTLTNKNVPPGTYQYRLAAFNYGSKYVYSDPVTVTVGASVPAPVVTSFSVAPQTIRAGQAATLSWSTQNATSVLIDNGVGSVATSGSLSVIPNVSTTYTLTASNGSTNAKATVTVNVVTAPLVVVSSAPGALLQTANSGGATTSFSLTNTGGTTTSVTLSQTETFFSQSPIAFSLQPGATQLVKVTGLAQPAGAFEGVVTASGNGVPAGLSIQVKLLSTPPPSGPVTAKPAANRVDVAGAAGASPSGTVGFTNIGTGTLTGIVVSDVAWLVPQPGIVTIPRGGTVNVSFSIDRSKRPDADALIGSATGRLSLVYPNGGPGALDVTPVTGISIVTVVDTVQLGVVPGAPPPLAAGEVALFVPGAGHVLSSVGTFISDISVLNPPGSSAINDLRFFFTPVAGIQQSVSLPPVASGSVSVADVVKNVFSGDGQLGSLQIRSGSASKVSVNTNIFNTSNSAGTYGTTIPTFRSDRAVKAGDRLTLTGLRQDATGHTNVFIQDTSGLGVTVRTEFLDTSGTTIATRSDGVDPFALKFLTGVVPNGTAAAVLTNMSSGNATFLAYATPVDEASSDNWSVVDWSRQFGYSGSDPVIVPVAGVLQGANDTLFRTDLAITNTGTSTATGTLRFYPRGGSPADRQITLGPRNTQILTNVIGTQFNAPNPSVGYLQFTPSSGTFALTSRTYTTLAGSVATFGTHVPTLPLGGGMSVGTIRAIGSLQDAAVATINRALPATFRTNFGIMETAGKSVTVRVTLTYSYSAGGKLRAYTAAQKDYPLAPNEFRQINGLALDILGSARDTLGDMKDLEADFQIVSGDGRIEVYTSSTDNGTGDVILRTQ